MRAGPGYRDDMSDGRRGWWHQHWRDVVYDGVPPLLLLSLGLLDSFTGVFTEPIGEAPVLTSLIPGALACLALVLRRRRPLLTLVIVLAVLVIPTLLMPTSLTYWDEFMVWVLALYSCARHASRRGAVIAVLLSAATMAILPIEFAEMRDAGGILFNSALLVGGFAIGVLARSWAGYRDRIMLAAAERAVAEERASRAERARIARELHDVISHTITVIVMQAGGARLASAHDPHAAADALARIEALGRESLAELRTLLEVLRSDEPESTGTAPQPGLSDIEPLCERMRALGLRVQLTIEGDGAADGTPLSPGIQLTAYRVVQEGLTNVLKHAGRVETAVTVDKGQGESLRIEVSSAPGSEAAEIEGATRGLTGLRERVEAAGGVVSTRSRDDGGFVLTARLPIVERVP
jgi:signal transduction histidine kinase